MSAKARRKAAAQVQKLSKEIAKGRVAVFSVTVVTIDGKVEASIGVSSDGVVDHMTVHGAAIGLRDVVLGLAEGFRALKLRNACESFARLHGAALTLTDTAASSAPRMTVTPVAAAQAKAIARSAIKKARPGPTKRRR